MRSLSEFKLAKRAMKSYVYFYVNRGGRSLRAIPTPRLLAKSMLMSYDQKSFGILSVIIVLTFLFILPVILFSAGQCRDILTPGTPIMEVSTYNLAHKLTW